MARAEQFTPERIDPDQIGRALRTNWHHQADGCVRVRTSPYSVTWRVEVGAERFAAKLVPAGRRARLEAGLYVAERLERAGVSAGLPIRAADGALTVPLDGVVLALLAWVPGRPLDPEDPIDQQWWGDTLGSVHQRVRGFAHPGLARFHWIRPDAAHLGVEPWVRPMVATAAAAVTKLCVTDQLTYGVLHGEPAAEAFRMDPDTGRTGLVDWANAATGPLAYDLAAAVAQVGGRQRAGELIAAYLAAGPVTKEELDAALPTMLRFRHAVQVDYLAHRVACADRVDRPAGLAALRAAREALPELDVMDDADVE